MLPYAIAQTTTDLTSPGPIGSVTPSTGNFTALTATTAAIGGATIGPNALAVTGTSAFSAQAVFGTNIVIGAADVNGVLLRVSSQTLFVRSGTDGATYDIYARTITAASAILSDTDGLSDIGSPTHQFRRLYLGGNISGAATTTAGSRFIQAAANVTDTSSSGTVATNYVNRWGVPTLLASSAATYTNNYANWFEPATASTNVTITNNWAAGFNGAINVVGGVTATSGAGYNFASSPNLNLYSRTTNALTVSSSSADRFEILAGQFAGVSNATIGWISNTNFASGTFDAMFTRGGAASIQQGAADTDLNSAIVAQTLRTQGALTGGTTNQAGKDFTTIVSPGKGTGISGQYIVQTAPAGSTGATVNAPATGLTVTAPLANMQPGVVIGNQALATTATDGFLWITSCAGPPTGVPTTFTGRVPLVYDSSNNQLYVYNSGWKQPKTPAGAAVVTWQ